MTQKIEKRKEFSSFEMLDVLFLRAEGFSSSLGVLYGDLKISKLQFLIKKIKIKFLVVNFFSNPGYESGIRIRDPDPQLEKILDPDPYPDPH
jgi:hypothetical protein